MSDNIRRKETSVRAIDLIALAAFSSTLAGGLLALGLRDKLHLILGFSAGAVIGVAFFDLLPEAHRYWARDCRRRRARFWP